MADSRSARIPNQGLRQPRDRRVYVSAHTTDQGPYSIDGSRLLTQHS